MLLQELGFSSNQINVAELAVCLEKEIKAMSEARSAMANPHVMLLQAILTLYRSEIRCLKNIVEQMHAEREKLKGDVLDANNRATMLAQEVDDNHARMEQNTQNQVSNRWPAIVVSNIYRSNFKLTLEFDFLFVGNPQIKHNLLFIVFGICNTKYNKYGSNE